MTVYKCHPCGAEVNSQIVLNELGCPQMSDQASYLQSVGHAAQTIMTEGCWPNSVSVPGKCYPCI